MDSITFLKALDNFKKKYLEVPVNSEEYKHLLFDVFKKALGDSVTSDNNAKIFVDNFDIILKLSHGTFFWTEFECIYKVPSFYEKLCEYIFLFPNKKILPNLIYSICKNSHSIEIFDYPELIMYVLSNSDVSYMSGIFMEDMNTDYKIKYLNYILKTKAPIDFWFANFKSHLDVRDFVIKHLDEFMEIVPNLFALRLYVQDNKYALKKINYYFNSHHKQVIDSIFFVTDFGEQKKEDIDNLEELIELLIDDICKNEDATYSDITFDAGCYSFVIFIKEKVLKIGKGRKTERFPNNPYIIKPLLRRKIKIGDIDVFLEAIEIGKRRVVTRSELYYLYKCFRKLGLIWTDVHPSNVGELKRDNDIYWKRKLELSDEILGLDAGRGMDIQLKKGDLVLFDADYIFDENDPLFFKDGNDVMSSLPLTARFFEEDYQKEKNLKLK